MSRVKNIINQKYNKLTAIRFEGLDANKNALWLFRCDCGTEKVIIAGSVRVGNATSCGHCTRSASHITHGLSRTKLGRTWYAILDRGISRRYASYRAKNITVCQGWKSIETFAADMGHPPSNKHSIDRINNKGGYWCGHCEECIANSWPKNGKWATAKEQQRNRDDNRFIEFNGLRLCVAEWAERTGLPFYALHSRLKRGWTAERAITQPLKLRANSKSQS